MNILWVKQGLLTFIFVLIGLSNGLSLVFADAYSPFADVNYPDSVYWGDAHVHTNLSVDANVGGNRSLGPAEAYRFAKGEVITLDTGASVQLDRPLDFLVVADHAIGLGNLAKLQIAAPALLKTKTGKRLYDRYQSILAKPDTAEETLWKLSLDIRGKDEVRETSFRQTMWQEVTANADRYNQPEIFTAFSGFEWTSFRAGSGGLHRVVIFKDDGTKTNQTLPYSRTDSNNPEDLWAYLENYQQNTGGDVLAIPHNGNLSGGTMFELVDSLGQPQDKRYAELRNRWEPLYEVTQIKGDSETHPLLSPNDKFSDYETWNGWKGREEAESAKAKQSKKYEYARSALQLGLLQQSRLGINPFKFGLIGSTDSHTSLATADESNFWGKYFKTLPSPGRIETYSASTIGWNNSAAGYMAIWAQENTRESLFAAMKRKEVYATTGPRINVRFFGGWDYQQDDAFKPDLARIGYNQGVPMGGDLTAAPDNQSPSFLIRAVKDPDGANLDRVQVIKGWMDAQGELHEKIYNVALSDERKENWRGKVKPVGSTVDIKDASYTNSVGDAELAVVWTDPDFNHNELAFYYLRVLEIPTPRWTAYDAKYFEIKDIPEEVPLVTQERAYSSPIWYSPI